MLKVVSSTSRGVTSTCLQALPGKDASSMEKHVFRCYDENDNGYIDPAEFMVSSFDFAS